MPKILLIILAFNIGLISLIFFIYAVKIVYNAKGEAINFNDPDKSI